MRKIILYVTVMMVLPSVFSYAQTTTRRKTAELMKDEMPSGSGDVLLGRITTTNTLREMVLRDPRLIPQNVNCEVLGYTCSISGGDKNFGPVTVKGPKFTSDMKDRISEWDANVTITIRDIQVKCSGQESTAKPIVVKYDR